MRVSVVMVITSAIPIVSRVCRRRSGWTRWWNGRNNVGIYFLKILLQFIQFGIGLFYHRVDITEALFVCCHLLLVFSSFLNFEFLPDLLQSLLEITVRQIVKRETILDRQFMIGVIGERAVHGDVLWRSVHLIRYLSQFFHNEEQKAVYWTEWDSFFRQQDDALWPAYDLLMFLLLLLLGSWCVEMVWDGWFIYGNV